MWAAPAPGTPENQDAHLLVKSKSVHQTSILKDAYDTQTIMTRGRPCWATVLNTTHEKAQLPECINLNATLPIHKDKNFTTKIKEKLHKEEELRIINEIINCSKLFKFYSSKKLQQFHIVKST